MFHYRGVYTNLGIAYHCLGDYKKAIEFHQQSLRIAKEIGDKGSEGEAYTNLGIAYECLGEYEKEIEFHQQSLSIAKDIGDKCSEGEAYTNLGIAYDCLGNYKKAIEFHQQSLSIAKEKAKRIPTSAVRIALSVNMKKQSKFISNFLVSQKRLETKV